MKSIDNKYKEKFSDFKAPVDDEDLALWESIKTNIPTSREWYRNKAIIRSITGFSLIAGAVITWYLSKNEPAGITKPTRHIDSTGIVVKQPSSPKEDPAPHTSPTKTGKTDADRSSDSKAENTDSEYDTLKTNNSQEQTVITDTITTKQMTQPVTSDEQTLKDSAGTKTVNNQKKIKYVTRKVVVPDSSITVKRRRSK